MGYRFNWQIVIGGGGWQYPHQKQNHDTAYWAITDWGRPSPAALASRVAMMNEQRKADGKPLITRARIYVRTTGQTVARLDLNPAAKENSISS